MIDRLRILKSCYNNSKGICDPVRFAARQQSLLECIAETLIEELEEKYKAFKEGDKQIDHD